MSETNMTEILQIITIGPWLCFIAICSIYYFAKTVVWSIRISWNRLIRHLNIRAQGWPPEHLDADGDFKPEPKTEEE